jgi:predicted nucleic acid-binding protein
VKSKAESVIYWDTSAILSALFRDDHSENAAKYVRSAGYHFVASLGWAEAHAVMGRIEREGALSKLLVDAARDALEGGPWRRINAGPNWKSLQSLAREWPLRGADLWHLATAKELQGEIPELTLLSFDQRLNLAAKGEGLLRGA